MFVDCIRAAIRLLVAMEEEEGISVEDVENPEIEALPSVENQRAGDDEEAAAGVQDHYQAAASSCLALPIRNEEEAIEGESEIRRRRRGCEKPLGDAVYIDMDREAHQNRWLAGFG
jgi:hypothetical protein